MQLLMFMPLLMKFDIYLSLFNLLLVMPLKMPLEIYMTLFVNLHVLFGINITFHMSLFMEFNTHLPFFTTPLIIFLIVFEMHMSLLLFHIICHYWCQDSCSRSWHIHATMPQCLMACINHLMINWCEHSIVYAI